MIRFPFIKNHPFFTVYCCVIIFLFPGVYYKSGYQYFDEVLLHLISFVVIYFLLNKYAHKINFSQPTATAVQHNFSGIIEQIPFIALILTGSFIAYHFIFIGYLPLVEVPKADNVVDIAFIRQNITTFSSVGINYLSSFIIRAVIPFFVVYSCLIQKKYFFIAWIICAVFYSLNLMQKSHILMAFLPLVLYFLLSRKYLKSFATMMIPVIGIFFLVFITNPGKVNHEDEKIELTAKEKLNVSSGSLVRRLMIVPGKTVGDWFLLIPSEYPFLNGCGYRFAKIFGCEHQDYSKLLYPRIYPHYAVKGLKGTVNVASFMYEYSNFGKIGLILAGLIIALLFLVVQKMFTNQFIWLVVFNFFPVLMLSSKSFTTLLFSGGWGLTILLFFIFRHKLTAVVK